MRDYERRISELERANRFLADRARRLRAALDRIAEGREAYPISAAGEAVADDADAVNRELAA